MRVGDLVAVGLDHRGAEERVVRRHRPLFQDGRCRHRLEHRARLEGLRNRFYLVGTRFRACHVGGVHVGQRGDGIDFARARIHHDRGAASGGHVLGGLGDAVLHIFLQLDVDRDHDVLAVDRRRLLLDTAGDGKAVFPALGGVGARRAGKNVVVLQLETCDTLAVDIAVADNLAADLAAGVFAPRVSDEVDAIEGKLLHLGGGIDIRLALHVDEGGGLLREQFPVRRRVAPEHVGDSLRLRRRVGDLGGVRIDRRRVDALREHRAIAIVDSASVGCGGERDRARLFGHRRIMGRLDDLEISQAQEENCGNGGKDKQKDEGAVRIHPLGGMA